MPRPIAGNCVTVKNGAVATSQPLAAAAGLKILKRGGNAVDAAIATAIALTVVEPTSNGIGGDAFAIVWDTNKPHGLNASGKSPRSLSLKTIVGQGNKTMPPLGWMPVTVPGAPSAWRDLHARFGRLPLPLLFESAIAYAEQGFKVSQVVAKNWQKSVQGFLNVKIPGCEHWMKLFADEKQAPKAGDIWFCPQQALTFKEMSVNGIDSFYSGEIAKKIIRFSEATNGYLTAQDLADHHNLWVDPVSTKYKDVDILELPPNGQGLAALISLAILDKFHIEKYAHLSSQSLHYQIEAMKLGCVDAYQHITDPEYCKSLETRLLNASYIDSRSALISSKAGNPVYGAPPNGGTVYLCTADSDGMMVSYIQSNYEGFGSGVVIPDTGIAMQNRGACFSLDPNHSNVLAGGKRPFHTIIPGFLMKDNKPIGPFGVMGGFMQPQGHVQVLSAMLDYGLDPQSALDMPR